MRPLNRRLFLILTALLVLAAPRCQRASGGDRDPVDVEAEETLRAYLRIDTSNPPGNESEGAKYLQQLLVKEGIPAVLVGSDPRRQSVYARLKSGSGEKALILLHHIDVVPVNQAEWTRPAFSGASSGGYLWGRGALDVKSLGIAELMALVDLKRRNVPLKRDVIYLAVADEEAGGLHGARELLEKRPDLFEGAGFVLNEAGDNETIVDNVTFWGIEVQQKLPLWLRLHTKGAPGHSATPPDDGGATVKLVRALAAVDRIHMPYRLTPAVQRFFRAAGARRRDRKGEVLRMVTEPPDPATVEKDLPPGYRALLRDTIALTKMSAGSSTNAIPGNASADLDIRLLPDEESGPMLARIREAVGDSVSVEVLLESLPAPESPADTELFRVMSRAMIDDSPGSTVSPIVSAGTSDSRYFRARGFVAYGVAPFRVNYYDADTVHGNDERIRTRFFAQGVHLMRRIVHDFCARQ
jgi:acetylornithine deacetylase/succinyl-diaminopimelate desuccinylase-like protein